MKDCSKHKKIVEKYDGSLQELAEDIGNLHYEELGKLFHQISQKIMLDGAKDRQRGRVKLAEELKSPAANLEYASQGMERAWQICKPYMKEE
jgi:hypothetical protein